jgi:hypothetical protein
MTMFARTLLAVGLLLTPALISTASARPSPCVICGAPGPIAGAGLPLLAAIGALGIYWVVRRRRTQ